MTFFSLVVNFEIVENFTLFLSLMSWQHNSKWEKIRRAFASLFARFFFKKQKIWLSRQICITNTNLFAFHYEPVLRDCSNKISKINQNKIKYFKFYLANVSVIAYKIPIGNIFMCNLSITRKMLGLCFLSSIFHRLAKAFVFFSHCKSLGTI